MALGSRVAQDMMNFYVATNKRQEVDTTDGSVIYMGWAKMKGNTSDAIWRIKRIIINGSNITTTWAEGNIAFTHVWDNRLALNYS